MEDLNQVILLLGQLHGKLDAVIARHATFEEDLKEIVKRVNTLEACKSKVLGYAMGVSGAISLLITIAALLFKVL